MKKIFVVLISILIAACGGNSSTDSGANTESNGRLSVGITDAPIDNADAVVVSFDAISIKPAEGEAIEITLDEAMDIDLLSYQGEERVLLLDGYSLEAGEYNWIRLSVVEADSYIEVGGELHSLSIPSGAQTGLQLNRPFTIGAGETTDFTLDFDLRKSVHRTGNGVYRLRPTVRIVDSLESGTVSGTVSPELITAEACNNGDNDDVGNAVYLFAGLDAIPQDEQGVDGDPLASALVSFNAETELYEFTIGFVAAGDYTAVFTCDASLDLSDEDNSDVVVFSDPINLSVVAGENSSIMF